MPVNVCVYVREYILKVDDFGFRPANTKSGGKQTFCFQTLPNEVTNIQN